MKCVFNIIAARGETQSEADSITQQEQKQQKGREGKSARQKWMLSDVFTSAGFMMLLSVQRGSVLISLCALFISQLLRSYLLPSLVKLSNNYIMFPSSCQYSWNDCKCFGFAAAELSEYSIKESR